MKKRIINILSILLVFVMAYAFTANPQTMEQIRVSSLIEENLVAKNIEIKQDSFQIPTEDLKIFLSKCPEDFIQQDYSHIGSSTPTVVTRSADDIYNIMVMSLVPEERAEYMQAHANSKVTITCEGQDILLRTEEITS